MIDWSVASVALTTLIDSLAFDAKPYQFRTKWADRKQATAYVGTEKKTGITLRLRTISQIGEDETRLVPITVDAQEVLAEAQVGTRRISIELRVESYSNTDALWAWTTIERIRSRLRRSSSREALDAIDFVLTEIGQTVSVSTIRDGREWSVCTAELMFNARFCDAESAAANWIESIEVESELDDTDGTLIPSPPNYTDVIEQ